MTSDLLGILELTVSKIQAKVFEKSAILGFDSETFIKLFMNSEACAQLDIECSHMQFAGDGYILEEFLDEVGAKMKKSDKVFSRDALHWIGYLYRYWHYYTGETSKTIYAKADANMLNMVYPAYHTLSCSMAIDRIKEALVDKSIV